MCRPFGAWKQELCVLAVPRSYDLGYCRRPLRGEEWLRRDYLRQEASAGRREDFEKYLATVPDVAPPETDRLE